MRILTGVLFAALFLLTGILTVLMSSKPTSALSVEAIPFQNVIYSWHLACWMIAGMMANYVWDLFRANKTLRDISLPGLILPVLVSPIVFFAVWSLVSKDERGVAVISLVWPLVAFQNGFFWQVVFSKAGAGSAAPPVQPAAGVSPHTVSSGGAPGGP